MEKRDMRVRAGELLGNDIGHALFMGRLVATMVSKKSGKQVTLQMKCKRKPEGARRWELCTFPEADKVFIDRPRRDDEGNVVDGQSVGSWSLTGQYGGTMISPYGQDTFDPELIWTAVKSIEIAAERAPVETDQYELLLGTHCLICGRELTEETSIRTNIGPVCRKKVGLAVEPDAAKRLIEQSEHFAEQRFHPAEQPDTIAGAVDTALEDRAAEVRAAFAKKSGVDEGSDDEPISTEAQGQMTILAPGQAASSAIAGLDEDEKAWSPPRPGRDAYAEADRRRREERDEAFALSGETDREKFDRDVELGMASGEAAREREALPKCEECGVAEGEQHDRSCSRGPNPLPTSGEVTIVDDMDPEEARKLAEKHAEDFQV